MSKRYIAVLFAVGLFFVLCAFFLSTKSLSERLSDKEAAASPVGNQAAAETGPPNTSRKDFLLAEYPMRVKKYPLNVFSKGINHTKVIALTFDDGPYGEQTPRILDILEEKGIKATFFVCGKCSGTSGCTTANSYRRA